ncbi:MAG: hypothetical protein IPO40_22050 [Fibrobacteres bacterium]|nr:hypothetical protein [Fibrobacterota bacterium]MBK9579762.1 hypothetical protein [Fibrobacterota bacterium]
MGIGLVPAPAKSIGKCLDAAMMRVEIGNPFDRHRGGLPLPGQQGLVVLAARMRPAQTMDQIVTFFAGLGVSIITIGQDASCHPGKNRLGYRVRSPIVIEKGHADRRSIGATSQHGP